MIKVVVVLVGVILLNAQSSREDLDRSLMQLSKLDNLNFESVFAPIAFSESSKSMSHALNSLVLPGWGQYKNGSKTSALVFFGIEVAAWTLYAVYNSKGNQGREDVNAFADNGQTGFNRLRYYHKVFKRAGLSGDEDELFQANQNYGIDDGTAYEALRSNAIWNQLRSAENSFGDGTHLLPESKTQQYYEMVGKYSMFIAGWGFIDDPNYNGPMPTTNYRDFGNGLNYGWPETGRDNRPGFILTYNDIRDEMNSYFGTSKWMLRAVFMNHIVSAIEALIVGKQGNKKLNFEYSTSFNRGVLIDQLTVNYRF